MMTLLYRFIKGTNDAYVELVRNKEKKEFLQGYPSIYMALMIALKDEVINEDNPELKLSLYYCHNREEDTIRSSYANRGNNIHYGELECDFDKILIAICGMGEYIIRYKKPVPGAEGVFGFYTCTLDDGTPEATEFDATKMVCGLPTAFSFIKHV